VIPLVRRSNLDSSTAFVGLSLNPVFTAEGIEVVLHPLEIVSIAIDQLSERSLHSLKEATASLARWMNC